MKENEGNKRKWRENDHKLHQTYESRKKKTEKGTNMKEKKEVKENEGN